MKTKRNGIRYAKPEQYGSRIRGFDDLLNASRKGKSVILLPSGQYHAAAFVCNWPASHVHSIIKRGLMRVYKIKP